MSEDLNTLKIGTNIIVIAGQYKGEYGRIVKQVWIEDKLAIDFGSDWYVEKLFSYVIQLEYSKEKRRLVEVPFDFVSEYTRYLELHKHTIEFDIGK